MRPLAAVLAMVAASCALATAVGHAQEDGGRRHGKRMPMRYASPGKIVGAEVAFNQLAHRKGQWTAFRETAADGAVMFVPQPVDARKWLKGRADPAQALTWQPHRVWMSCDGSLAASYGAWQAPGGGTGYFTTIWQRQEDGGYKWVMDQGDDLDQPLPAPEMIEASAAFCKPRGEAPAQPAPPPRGSKATAPAYYLNPQGSSDDKTLSWSIAVEPDCGRTLTVSVARGPDARETVLSRHVAPPKPTDGKPPARCAA